MHRWQRFIWAAPLLAGAILGLGLYYLVADSPDRSVELATRDRRRPPTAPTRSHYRPALPSDAPAPAPGRDPARPGAGPSLEHAPRDPAEWQGMLVNTTFQALCDTSSRCGLAMACDAGRCGACARDSDCATGEVCSLQHCVLSSLAACRSRADCPTGELCLLTGYASDPRGNGDMRAYCSGSPPPSTRNLDDEEAALAAETARARPVPLATNNPGTPEGLVHLLQD